MARPRLISDEQILATTRSCVLEQGAQVSLDLVAKELGVTGPALLKRFGNREKLLIRALKPPENPAFLTHFVAGPDERPFKEQLLERLTDISDFLAEIIPCVAALRESGVAHAKIFDPRRDGPVKVLRAMTAWLVEVDAAGLAAVRSPDTVAHAMLGAIQVRAFTAHITKVKWSDRSNREYLLELVELFDRALTPTKSQKPRRQEVA